MPFHTDFPGGTVIKNPPVNAGDVRDMNWVGKIPWRRAWQPTPENPMDIGAWWPI